jgi:hypothetical protein
VIVARNGRLARPRNTTASVPYAIAGSELHQPEGRLYRSPDGRVRGMQQRAGQSGKHCGATDPEHRLIVQAAMSRRHGTGCPVPGHSTGPW